MREIEDVIDGRVTLKPDTQLHHEQFDVMTI